MKELKERQVRAEVLQEAFAAAAKAHPVERLPVDLVSDWVAGRLDAGQAAQVEWAMLRSPSVARQVAEALHGDSAAGEPRSAPPPRRSRQQAEGRPPQWMGLAPQLV